MEYDLLIIGAGTAGLSAAIYGTRAGLSTLCIEEALHGGQIINTPDVANYPGIQKITGMEFANQLYQQATSLGAKTVYEQIVDLDLETTAKRIITNRNEYHAGAVIIANGVHHRELGCSGEAKWKGKGVSYCATCDGNFFKNKVVCVVGGGNTALEDALYLSRICKEVHLIHRRDEFRANAITVEQIKQTKNIKLHLFQTVVEILGDTNVNAVILRSIADDEQKEVVLSVDGIFIAIGLQPQNSIFSRWVNLDAEGYIIAEEDCKTKTEGVFVAGDTRTKEVRQLITASSDGAIAAVGAARYLNIKK